MGRSFQASCSHCGYQKQVETGGTRNSFRTDDMFPALCFNCSGGISHVNRIPTPPVCYKCGGIDVTLYGGKTRDPADKVTYYGDDEGQLSGVHACPVCSKYALRFDTIRGRFVD